MGLRMFRQTILFVVIALFASFDVAFSSWWSFGNAKSEDVEDFISNNLDDDSDNIVNDIKEDIEHYNIESTNDNNKNVGEEEPKEEHKEEPKEEHKTEYGVDVSFPMHHARVSNNYAWLQHNLDPTHHSTPEEHKGKPVSPFAGRQDFYDRFLEGCVDHYGPKGQLCISTENDRIAMSLRQPQSMQNYTENGFKKIKAPEELFKLISDFWEINKDKQSIENWGSGNTYTNNWNAPTYMVSVEDTKLRGGGYRLKQAIWSAAQSTLQEWTGQELTQCSLYGIRVYKTDAVLASHVDRMPLVTSAIINVAADVDEPWPLEVIGHDGKATNVTMVPGDMVLYESHSVIHGRPFPLKGRYVANVFIHFEPTGHTLRHNAVNSAPDIQDVNQKYRRDVENGIGGHESAEANNGLPPYLIAGTPEEPYYRRTHPAGGKADAKNRFQTGSTTALHRAAQQGDVDAVKTHLKANKNVNVADKNGWTALHEASRGGHTDVVKYLLENGASVNMGTGSGETALYWAKKNHGEDHPVVELLVNAGGMEMGPEL